MKAKITPVYRVSKLRRPCHRPKKHQHRCPLCRKISMETDEVCGVSIDHVFACIPCLQNYLLCLDLEMDVAADGSLD